MEENWHALSLSEVFTKLDTNQNGLSSKDAQKRLAKYGPNVIEFYKKNSAVLLFLNQFKSPLIYVLILAAILTYFLKHTIDTYVILAVVLINAFVGTLHEIKAEKAMAALKKMMALRAKVKRDGVWHDLLASEIVPGDMVEIQAGLKIPADLRIIEENNFRLDESILTGESLPQEKKTEVLSADTPLGDRINMLYGGTMVISGHGFGLAVATGRTTQFGAIANDVSQAHDLDTPLQQKLNKFSQTLIILVLISVSIIFILGINKGFDLVQMLLTSLSAAVSAIPEGLPAIITITLATGAHQMAKRNAIIKKLNAVETLGSITAIAADKTGTLTHNQMTIEKIYLYPEEKVYEISGSGYEPKGEFSPGINDRLKKVLTYGVLCSDAEIYEENREWAVNGDPTEGALITAAAKAGIAKEEINRQYPRLDEAPFETEKGYMATINQFDNKSILIVKGKTEKILAMSALSQEQKNQIHAQMENFAQSALRVIAVAIKELPSQKKEITADVLANLDFIGLAGMMDPPRKEAIEAIEACRLSGIRPIMITGDYGLTARAVAKDLQIIRRDDEPVASGEEIMNLSGEAFEEKLRQCSVYARISPAQKLKIVEGLQKIGYVVAVTGDGINDAPALKQADVGVAMGEGGTDVSREVADLVLSDNNFATIVAAIEEGRTVFQNIRRAIFYLLSTNIGELLILLTATAFLLPSYPLPLLPVQILWLNLVTDGTAGVALALEPTKKGIIKFPPRSPKENILNATIIGRIILVSLVMLAITLPLYLNEINQGSSVERARTVAFVTMSVLQIFNLLNARSLRESVFSASFLSNRYIPLAMAVSLLLTFLTVESSLMRTIFHTTILSAGDWLKIIALSFLIVVAVEIEKLIQRKINVRH